MAFTDPVLAANDAVISAAREALGRHRSLVEKIEQFLPDADARWKALSSKISNHELRNADTLAAQNRFGELLKPGSGERTAVDEKLKKFPKISWLQDLATVPATLDSLEANLAPLIQHGQEREAALASGIEEFLNWDRKAIAVRQTRLETIVGRLAVIGGYKFYRIAVDDEGGSKRRQASGYGRIDRALRQGNIGLVDIFAMASYRAISAPARVCALTTIFLSRHQSSRHSGAIHHPDDLATLHELFRAGEPLIAEDLEPNTHDASCRGSHEARRSAAGACGQVPATSSRPTGAKNPLSA